MVILEAVAAVMMVVLVVVVVVGPWWQWRLRLEADSRIDLETGSHHTLHVGIDISQYYVN